MKSAFALSLLAASFFTVARAEAAPMTLQNDSFIDGGAAGFNGGFASGERGAVTLGPLPDPFTLSSVRFLFGGANSTQTVTLRIYLDNGQATPGSEIFNADYQVQGSDSAFQEIDLTADNIGVAANQRIRVAVEVSHSGFPGLAHDADGIQDALNWLYSGGNWVDFDFILPGDLIIRAEVDTQPGGTGTATGTGTGTATGTSTETATATGTGTSTDTSSNTGTGTSVGACTPGESVSCTGPGGCTGGQACNADGTGFDACACGSASGDGASEDDGGCSVGPTASAAPREGTTKPWAGLLGLALAGIWLARRRRRS